MTEYPLRQTSITRSHCMLHLLNACGVKVIYPSNLIMQHIKFSLHTYLSGLTPYANTLSLGKGNIFVSVASL